jgi:hypothetical protein
MMSQSHLRRARHGIGGLHLRQLMQGGAVGLQRVVDLRGGEAERNAVARHLLERDTLAGVRWNHKQAISGKKVRS